MKFRIAFAAAAVLSGAPAVAQDDFIKGTYSTPEGCAALKANTVDEGDFLFLRARGFEALEFRCEFVQVLPRKDDLPGVVAVAFCEEPGLQYPKLFTVMPTTETTLSVGTPESGNPPDEAGQTSNVLAGEYQLCPGA